MAPLFAIIPYALLETFFCIPILPKTNRRPVSHYDTDQNIYKKHENIITFEKGSCR